MEKYLVREVQNLASTCEPAQIFCKDARDAKRVANKFKVFQGTILMLSDQFDNLYFYKKDGKWYEVPAPMSPLEGLVLESGQDFERY